MAENDFFALKIPLKNGYKSHLFLPILRRINAYITT